MFKAGDCILFLFGMREITIVKVGRKWAYGDIKWDNGRPFKISKFMCDNGDYIVLKGE